MYHKNAFTTLLIVFSFIVLFFSVENVQAQGISCLTNEDCHIYGGTCTNISSISCPGGWTNYGAPWGPNQYGTCIQQTECASGCVDIGVQAYGACVNNKCQINNTGQYCSDTYSGGCTNYVNVPCDGSTPPVGGVGGVGATLSPPIVILSGSSQTVSSNAPYSFTVSVSASGSNPINSVKLEQTGAPNGGSFSNSAIGNSPATNFYLQPSGNGTTDLTFTGTAGTVGGTYPITFKATSNTDATVSGQVTVNLIVNCINATTPVMTAPASVALNSNFEITCDYGSINDYVQAPSGCSYPGSNGGHINGVSYLSATTFACTAPSTAQNKTYTCSTTLSVGGSFTNFCTLPASVSKVISIGNPAPFINSVSVSPNPVPYLAITNFTVSGTNLSYCYVLVDGDWGQRIDNGYYTNGIYTTAVLTAVGAHNAWVYCYNTTWVGTPDWVQAPFVVNPAPDSATCQSMTGVPANVIVGTPINTIITMKNTGMNTWNTTAPYGLLDIPWSADPAVLPWLQSWNGLPAGNVAPGGTATFNITVKAPTTIGTYNFDWQMLHNGVAWFGDVCHQVVNVIASTPTINSVTISSPTIHADNTTPYTITVSGSDAAGAANIQQIHTMINYQGVVNPGAYRGYLEWYGPGDAWPAGYKNHQLCTGAGNGYAAFQTGFGSSYMYLDSCSLVDSGNTRTARFVVHFDPSFTTPILSNDISGYIANMYGNNSGWKNFPALFNLYVSPITVSLSATPAGPLSAPGLTTLTWTTTGNPDSCDGSNYWIGSKAPGGGTELRSAIPVSIQNFIITCHKAGVADAINQVNVIVVNNTPGLPTMTLPLHIYKNIPATFNFSAIDPNNDLIRYAIDWDGNGTIDEWVPAESLARANTSISSVGGKIFQAIATYAFNISDNKTLANTPQWAASKALQADSHAFPSLGANTIKMQVQNSHSFTSGWASFRIVVEDTPLSTINISNGSTTNSCLTITSSDPSISCGTGCAGLTRTYAVNASAITLTATPNTSSCRFTGWTGDCTGPGICILNPNASRTVTANYTMVPTSYREF